ncbi:MAG: hypothetical protein OHK0017_01670 [Patescibacteria group bacterium]
MSEHTKKHEAEDKVADSSTSETSSKKTVKKSEKKAGSKKGLWYGLGGLVALLVLLLVAFFASFGTQTLAAQSFDAVGLHKQALALDTAKVKGFDYLNKVGGIDPKNPESCGALLEVMNYHNVDFAALSGTTYVEVKPVSSTYADKLNYSGTFQGVVNIKDATTEIMLDNTANFDSALLDKLNGTTSSSNLGQASINLKAGAKLNKDAGFLSLMNMALKSKDVSLEGRLNNWYKQDLGLSQTQKEGIQEISTVVNSWLLTKPTDAFTDESLKEMYVFYCNGIEKVEIGSPKTVEFGVDPYRVAKKVRPISVVMKSDSQKIYTEKLPDLMVKLAKDSKLRSFLKGQYDNVNKLAAAAAKIDPSMKSTTVPTKAEFEQQIDKSLDEVKKEDIAKSLESSSTTEESFTINYDQNETYLDMETLQPYGSSMVAVIKPTANYLQTQTDPTLNDLIKDGIRFKVQNYEGFVGSKAKTVVVPGDTKSFEDFTTDILKSTPAEDISKKLAPQATPSNNGGSTNDSSTMPALPTGDEPMPTDTTNN